MMWFAPNSLTEEERKPVCFITYVTSNTFSVLPSSHSPRSLLRHSVERTTHSCEYQGGELIAAIQTCVEHLLTSSQWTQNFPYIDITQFPEAIP